MGLFALTSSGLSLYIWLATIWDVYHPLSATINSKAPSMNPVNLLELILPRSEEVTTPAQRPRKRNHVRMENAQREEVRGSLKAVIIWLVLKGLEPVFDNSLGYLLPLYSIAKVLVLLVYIRFRSQLSRHLFDSFVLPLGKPNTPLLDLGAFNSIIFPTARFLLSLPFAHLVVAVKNQLSPLIQNWMGPQAEEVKVENDGAEQRALGLGKPSKERIPLPASRKVSAGKWPSLSTSSTLSRGRPKGKGGGGGGLGEGTSVSKLVPRKQSSSESLAAHEKRAASIASTGTPAYALLESLPAAPKDSPINFHHHQQSPSTVPSTQSSLRQFAFIPPATPPSNTRPASQIERPGIVDEFNLLTPKMPGFMVSQGKFNDSKVSGSFGSPSSLPMSQSSAEVANSLPVKSNGVVAAVTEGGGKAGLTADERKVPPNEEGKKNSASGTRRKRVEEESDSQPLRKSRVSPSKGRGRVKTTPLSSTNEEKKDSSSKTSSIARAHSSSSLGQNTTARSSTRIRKRVT